MKRFSTAISLVSLLYTVSYAQSPGGVEGYAAWGNETTPVELKNTQGLTFIGVGQVSDNKERTIWSTGNGKAVNRIQTTSRAANLDSGTFMNYPKQTLPAIRLFTYTSATGDGKGQTFYVGHHENRNLPVTDMKNGIREYAVYNRALSARERSRVESYMALKYGITLRHNYLNSQGAVIWNTGQQKNYNNRIAGIINDPHSGLTKTAGRSSEEDAFITVKTRALKEGSSCIWGDNNKKLAFSDTKTVGKWLAREWTCVTRAMNGNTADVVIDTKDIRQLQPLSDGESYYLAVDGSGTGKYPLNRLKYYKGVKQNGDSIIFQNIDIAKTDGPSVFTLRAAEDMFPTLEVSQPCCATGAQGSLGLLITGGTAPYRINILDENENKSIYERTTFDSIIALGNIEQGRYRLQVTDRMNNAFTNTFIISNSYIPDAPELSNLVLEEGANREYTPEQTNNDYAYAWETPDGKYTDGKRITFGKDGTYILHITNKEGCTTTRALNVSTTDTGTLDNYRVSPNPTTDGYVKVQVELNQPASLTLLLYTTGGALVSREERDAATYHTAKCYLPATGVYMLTLQAGSKSKTVKLIRK